MKVRCGLWLAILLLIPSSVTRSQEPKPSRPSATEPSAPVEEPVNPEPEPPVEKQSSSLPVEIIPRDYLILPAVGTYGKAPIHIDPVDALLASGEWKTPAKGDEIQVPSGAERRWKEQRANDEGVLDASDIRGGYAVTTFDSPEERVMILQASGHALVYVNGEPRAGDVYGYGWLELPVLIRKGRNELLFQTYGESLAVKLTEPAAPVYFLTGDATLPDLVESESEERWAAVPVVNATRENLIGHLSASIGDGAVVNSPLPKIPPFSVFKAPVQLPGFAATAGQKANVDLAFLAGPLPPKPDAAENPDAATTTPEKLAQTQVALDAVAEGKLHMRTFRSGIDGSVQSYAVLPAGGDDPTWEGTPGIILSLHGPGVDARTHVSAYQPKRWAHLVAPTNRRPHGFDWEDWGRIDALEALADAEKRFPNDTRRRYVTGHSMGGHGAWHLGVTYPDQFAAISPIAGWPSYWSYGGGMPSYDDPTPIEEVLLRGNAPSDTLTLIHNLSPIGVYLLHGERDDDRHVSVAQSRFMRAQLGKFHPDFAYYEKSAAGHWWGNETVDFPRMMQFLRNHKLPAPGGPATIDFATANPGISSRSHWAAIEAQEEQLEPSRIILDQTPTDRRIVGRTENVQRLMLDLGHFPPGRSVRVQLDGLDVTRVRLPRGDDKRVWLAKRGDRWRQIPTPPPRLKGPHRYGTLKAAFNHRVMLVYGTRGTSEENSWAAAKARFDAETFWYRGNGALEVVADTDFNPDDDRDSNVILYGNSETNAAWPALLSLCPVQLRKGLVTTSLRPESGDDLGVLFCWPRQGSDEALVGVVGGTGIKGMRLTNRLRYFIAGIAYPDLMLFGPNVLTEGTEDIRAIGYFGNDWKVNSGEIVWRDVAL